MYMFKEDYDKIEEPKRKESSITCEELSWTNDGVSWKMVFSPEYSSNKCCLCVETEELLMGLFSGSFENNYVLHFGKNYFFSPRLEFRSIEGFKPYLLPELFLKMNDLWKKMNS